MNDDPIGAMNSEALASFISSAQVYKTMYDAFILVGFTEGQAMRFISTTIEVGLNRALSADHSTGSENGD